MAIHPNLKHYLPVTRTFNSMTTWIPPVYMVIVGMPLFSLEQCNNVELCPNYIWHPLMIIVCKWWLQLHNKPYQDRGKNWCNLGRFLRRIYNSNRVIKIATLFSNLAFLGEHIVVDDTDWFGPVSTGAYIICSCAFAMCWHWSSSK